MRLIGAAIVMAAVAPLTTGTADLSSAPWPSVYLHHILLHKCAAPCSFFILLWWRPNWFAFANKQKRSAKDKHRLSWPHPLIHIRIVMINVSIALYCIAPPPASKNLGTKWFRRTPYLYSACRRRQCRRLVSKIKKRGSDRWYLEPAKRDPIQRSFP